MRNSDEQKVSNFKRALIAFAAFGIAFALAHSCAHSQPVNPGVQVSGNPANNDCTKFVVVGGTVQSITTAGGACAATGVATFNGRNGAVAPVASDYGGFDQFTGLVNCTVTVTVSTSNLIANLTDAGGNTPSATSPCVVTFGNSSPTNPAQVTRVVTSAVTLQLNSGSTLGTTSNIPFKLWFELFDTGSGVALSVSNQSIASQIFPLFDFSTQVSTACASCINATAAGTFYTTTAFAGNRIRILGWAVWASGLPTAGAWTTGPSRVQAHGGGDYLPNTTLQTVQATDTSNVTNATTVFANTNTTQTISLHSQADLVAVYVFGLMANSVGSCPPLARLSRGGTPIGEATQSTSGGATTPVPMGFLDSPGVAGSVTYTVQIAASLASCTASWNSGVSGTGSTIILQEIVP